MSIIKKKNIKGFSLAELLVALTLLVLAATAFVPVFSFVATSNNQDKIIATSNSLAAGVFEQISGLKYDEIGTVGGNPAGVIPPIETKTYEGIAYKIESRIAVGTDVDKDGNTILADYKNIRVIVTANNAFTHTETRIEKIYSISAREGEGILDNTGSLLVSFRDVDNNWSSSYPVINVKVTNASTGAIVALQDTDYAGEAPFFSLSPSAISCTYGFNFTIPTSYKVAGSTLAAGSSYSRSGINIIKWNTSTETVYMDQASKFKKITLTFKDGETNQVIQPTGSIALDWTIDGVTRPYMSMTTLNSYPFVLHDIFPSGTYTIKLSSIRDGVGVAYN
ncbi:MAG: prepilin-type N-terminal cleavage/methylation domain-containing protein, partial [Clostridia bacterium]|nr:prepilin-type N-terminal cleavage/methylation domain-containing protein [Clostridia bacterium]